MTKNDRPFIKLHRCLTYLTCLMSALFLEGSFGKEGAQTDHYVEWLREYCQAFFYGLSLTLLPAVTVAETGCSFRVNSNSHNLQILTGKFGNLIDVWYFIYRNTREFSNLKLDCARYCFVIIVFFMKFRGPAKVPEEKETKGCFLHCWNHNDWPLP